MREYKDISYDWKDYIFDLFISEDRWEWLRKTDPRSSDERFAKNVAAMALSAILSNRRCSPEINNDTLEQALADSGIHRVAILDAHGSYVDGVWHYTDTRKGHESVWEYDHTVQVVSGEEVRTASQLIRLPDGFIFPAELGKVTEVHPVSRWIEQRSGINYGALVLNCCNELGLMPYIKETAIFYVEGNIGLTASYHTRLLKPTEMSAPSK